MDKNKATAIIEETFDKPFNKQIFTQFIQNLLNDIHILNNDYNATEAFKDYISNYSYIGNYKDPNGEIVDILQIEVCEENKLDKARTSLRNFVVDHLGRFNHNCALAAYYSKSDKGNRWRFSFIKIENVTSVKDGKIKQQTEYSPAKRYSFLVGEDRYNRTAKERLLPILENEYNNPTIKQIEDAFSVEALTKQFYTELFDWYQWALSDEMGITYPNSANNEEHLIRLITRFMFVWFIKQKKLVPDSIFEIARLQEILSKFDPTSQTDGNYYNAILQNLFFATLNRKIEERNFASEGGNRGNEHYGIKTLFRDNREKSWFRISHEEALEIFKPVPFLNGGLFECLDKETQGEKLIVNYCDGFSREDNKNQRTFIPNLLFFDAEKGLISILKRYNFTIEENTPNDLDVALDPELLGKVFENLLGAYNPETKETARKQSGSFYTPREIVNYMVDESLVAYLKQTVSEQQEEDFRKLLVSAVDISNDVKAQIYNALRNCKILDPACGSGAFPMGILNRIICIMEHLGLSEHFPIFDLKLHLIENCIFGIDRQTIAVQISKLRFFISLIVEQKPTEITEDNYGIHPLPNLETKFVAANTLIGLKPKNPQGNLFEDPQIEVTKKSLLEVRHQHFSAVTAQEKNECRSKDERLRNQLASLLEVNKTFAPEDAKQLAAWNPYNQNASSPFFDAEWMFGVNGFDIVIGNPPYVLIGNVIYKQFYQNQYTLQSGKIDLYRLFIESSIVKLCKRNGVISFITPNTFLTIPSCELLRRYLLNNLHLLSIVNYTDKVFDPASVNNVVFVLKKTQQHEYTIEVISNDTKYYVPKDVCLRNLKAEINIFVNNKEQFLLEKITNQGVALDKFGFVKIALGEQPYHNTIHSEEEINSKFMHSKTQINSSYMIELGGKNILRYGLKMRNDNWLNFGANLYTKPNFDFFSKERIILREIVSKQLIATYTDEIFLVNKSCYSIISESLDIDLKFILGILNSKMIGFFVSSIGDKSKQGLFPRITMNTLKKVPIPTLSIEQQQSIIVIVNQILSAKQENPLADTLELECEIDKLVYELYGLTDEEIKIIERK